MKKIFCVSFCFSCEITFDVKILLQDTLSCAHYSHLTVWCFATLAYFLSSLTGDGPEDIRNEDLHQALVQAVVTVTAPAQHWVILAQQNQAGLRETLL